MAVTQRSMSDGSVTDTPRSGGGPGRILRSERLLRWFAWATAHWMRFKHAVLERARATWAWRTARVLRRRWLQRWRQRR